MADPGYKLPKYEGSTKGEHDQWIRKWTLTINDPKDSQSFVLRNDQAEAGELRMTFEIHQLNNATPHTAVITLYNLKDETAISLIREFSKVNLQAGYVTGHYGVIFEGVIKQFKKGRESAIDTYLKLFCADADAAHNQYVINTVLPVGWTVKDMQETLIKEQTKYGVARGNITQMGGTVEAMQRPAVQWGNGVDEIASYTATTRKTWTVQQGKIVIQDATAYAPGDIVVINSGTGMIGIPEVTQDGIQVTCLLNPNLYLKGRVQLDNRTFNTMFAGGGAGLRELRGQTGQGNDFAFPGPGATPTYASTAWDGVYCIVVLDHNGDTRGLEWYTHLTCWAMDGSMTQDEGPVKGQKQVEQA